MPHSRAVFLLCAGWLSKSACALARGLTQQKSLAANDSLVSYWSTAGQENGFLVVPQLKLLMCAVPKNACTQFELVANGLTGHDDSFLSDWSEHHDLESMLKDHYWTKAVFVRDPLDRLVSGYRSKCEPPMEGKGFNCMNFEDSTPTSWPSFDNFASELHRCHNPHFDPQVSFCSLGSHFDRFNYVGTITKDYQAVAADVRLLFQQAAQRSRSTVSHELLTELIEKYFPSEGFTKGHLDHYHTDTDVHAYYKNESTLDAALQHYVVDYDMLPLKPPAWVSKSQLDRARKNALEELPARIENDPRFSCRLSRSRR